MEPDTRNELSSEDLLAENMPSNRVRDLLFGRIRTESDFEAFCSDNFPATARLFTSGMDRQSRISLLFQREGANVVLQRLREQFPPKGSVKELVAQVPAIPITKHHASPRRARRTQLQHIALLAVPCLGLAVGLFLLSRSQLLHQITPFGSHQRGIVIYQSIFAGTANSGIASMLCETLETKENTPVRCERLLPMVSQVGAARNAANSGAVIAAVLVEGPELSVSALISGPYYSLLPLSELPRLPLVASGEVLNAARALNLLRRYLSGGEDDCNAPFEWTGVEPHFALVGILLRFHCVGGRPLEGDGDSREYRAMVRDVSQKLCTKTATEDPFCALSQYFLALGCPEDKDPSACDVDPKQILTNLVQTSNDARFKQLAHIELSRRICDSSPKDALALIDEVQSQITDQDACKQASLAPMVVCARLSLSEGKWQDPVLTPQLYSALHQCPRVGSPVLAEIGCHQLRRKHFEAAEKALSLAHKMLPSTRTTLALAESKLLLGQPREGVISLISVPHADRALATHAAFLLWLTDPSPARWNDLLLEYRKVPLKQLAVYDSTRTLHELACVKVGLSSLQCQALGILSSQKLEEDRLERFEIHSEKPNDR